MLRRAFLAGAAAIAAMPGAALALTGKAYTRGLVEEELAAGKTVFVDFYTDWCVTCRSQASAIRKFKKDNPAYEQHISFIAVDFDKHASSQIAKKLGVRRRATLVALKGDQELGRLVFNTRRPEIKALMDKALAAATGEASGASTKFLRFGSRGRPEKVSGQRPGSRR